MSSKKRKESISQWEYIGQNVYIRPHYIISCPEFFNPFGSRSQRSVDNEANLKDNSSNGLLSTKAKQRLTTVINWLLVSAQPKDVFNEKWKSWFKFKVNFITLTLPNTDVAVNEVQFKSVMLNSFLTYMRKFYKLKNYVWKLEYQKNGKLHIHITTDTYIEYTTIRKVWNKILISNGCMSAFEEKFGHTNPNSTDVHSVRKVKDLGAYLCKYMAKDNKGLLKFKGRIWGCNQELSKALNCKVHIPSPECGTELRCLMNKEIDYKEIQCTSPKTGLLITIAEKFYIKYNHWQTIIKGEILNAFQNTVLQLQNLVHDNTLFSELNTATARGR